MAQQPLSEVEFLVEMFTKPGDLVVDPCGGAFTTGVACLRNYRRFFGCDVEQHWVANEQEPVNKVRAELISNLQIWIEDMYDMNGPIDVVLSEWSKWENVSPMLTNHILSELPEEVRGLLNNGSVSAA